MPFFGPPAVPATVGTPRLYRARGVAVSGGSPLPGAWSAPISPSPGPTTQYHYFLSDPTDPTSGAQFDLMTDWKPLIHEENTIYYAIGRAEAIKSSAGTKGMSGTMEATTTTYAAWQRIVALLKSTAVLLLQTPVDQYYLTLDGDRTGDVLLATYGRTDFSQVKHQFVYVAAARP